MNIPYDEAAEQAVLGSVLIDTDMLRVVHLEPDDFWIEKHKNIFAAMVELGKDGTGINQITVAHTLAKNDKLESSGGDAYLSGLIAMTPTSLHAEYFAGIVRDHAASRRIISLGHQLQTSGQQGVVIKDISAAAINSLLRLQSNVSTSLQTVGEIAHDEAPTVQMWMNGEREILGHRTGFNKIDRSINGLEGGKLYVVAARPSMGKTMIKLNIAKNLAETGLTPVIYSMEQNKRALMERMVFAKARLNRYKLIDRNVQSDEHKRFWKSWEEVSKLPLIISDATALKSDYIMMEVLSLQASRKVDAVFVDYITLASDTGDNEPIRIGKIVQNMKNLARLANIPVVVLSQLNRSVESRPKGERRPTLADLRDSGRIEEIADVVMGLYRDEYYDEDTKAKNILEIHFLKNRDGYRGHTDIFYDASTGAMGDLA